MTRLLIGLLCASSAVSAQDSAWEFAGDAGLELRLFPQSAQYPDQDDSTVSPSVFLQPEAIREWSDGLERITIEPFLRLDKDDDHRTHFDIREANYIRLNDTWDMKIGISRVFWGVTESVHLVDVINQTDAVEDIDSEDKLGQPMLNVNWLTEKGTFSIFVLPGFRERTFPARDARRRGPLRILQWDPEYESGAEEWHVDYAARWSHFIGSWDIALSHFYGTNREPRLVPELSPTFEPQLRPYYELMHQSGLELQYTGEKWLLKLEAMYRDGELDSYFAAVGGFEYTFYQIFETNVDLGVLVEYQYDGRETDGTAPFTVADDDLFLGGRLALNNEASTAVLAGVVFDLNQDSVLGLVELEHRLSNSLMFELETRLISSDEEEDPVYFFRRDDAVTLRLTYGF